MLVMASSGTSQTNQAASIEAHEQAECRQCHFATSAGASKVANSNCFGCHREKATAQPIRAAAIFHSDPLQTCVDCHFFHEPQTIITAAGTVNLATTARVDQGHCLSCHSLGADRTKLNSAHQQAAALYHGQSEALIGQSPSTGCLSCHDRNSDSVWRQATAELPLTFYTHASHPIGKMVVPGSGPAGNRMKRDIDPRIPLFEGRMECQSCHALTAGTKDLLLPFAGPKQLCLGCHQLDNKRQLADNESKRNRPTVMATFK